MHSWADGFEVLPNSNPDVVSYGTHHWPYRLLMAARPQAAIHEGSFEWSLRTGAEAALMIALDGTEKEAEAALADLSASPDLYDQATHRDWNQYLASAPLVAPADPVKFTVGTTGQQERITPEELVRSQLWFWRGLLNTTCQARYLPASPLMIADWNVFMGMWSNDGIAETQAMAATDRKDLARSAILSWFRYSVNAQGDGTSAWTIFPSGKNTFAAGGPERNTQGVQCKPRWSANISALPATPASSMKSSGALPETAPCGRHCWPISEIWRKCATRTTIISSTG